MTFIALVVGPWLIFDGWRTDNNTVLLVGGVAGLVATTVKLAASMVRKGNQ